MEIIASFNETRQVSAEGHSEKKHHAKIFDDFTQIKNIIKWYNSFTCGSKSDLILTVEGKRG